MNFKKAILTFLVGIFLFSAVVTPAFARVRVKGYTKRNGTYVAPHYRTNKNSLKYDNWSTKGNINPYTGKKGYKNF